MIQNVIVFIIIATALAFAGYKIYNTFKHPDNCCTGCKDCPVCNEMVKKHGIERRKPDCFKKKT